MHFIGGSKKQSRFSVAGAELIRSLRGTCARRCAELGNTLDLSLSW